MNAEQYIHLHGTGRLTGDSAQALVPTGALLSNTSEMEIGDEPVHREGL